MAHLLQGLIAAVLIANTAVAQDKPFSHRQHLSLKLACTTCHASVTSSTKASDNNLPSTAVCASCHTDRRQVRAAKARRVDHFNHQFHAKFGNIAPVLRASIASKQHLSPRPPTHLETTNACAGCHHGIEQSEDPAAASVFPPMADCLVCHNKMDPPFSCEKCHNNVPALKPASHSSDFLDKHNRMKAALDKTECFTCHGKQFTCLGCH